MYLAIRGANLIHTERQAHSWSNNTQNIAFLSGSYLIMSCHVRNDTRLFPHIPEWASLGTRLFHGRKSANLFCSYMCGVYLPARVMCSELCVPTSKQVVPIRSLYQASPLLPSVHMPSVYMHQTC